MSHISPTFNGRDEVFSVARAVPGVLVQPDEPERAERAEDLLWDPRQPVLRQIQISQQALGSESVGMDGLDPVLLQAELGEVCESAQRGLFQNFDEVPLESQLPEDGGVSEPGGANL